MLKDDIYFIYDIISIYLDKLIYFFIIIIILFYIFIKNIKITKFAKFNIKDILILLSFIIIIYLGIRSNISGKPFGISDSFVTNKTSSGNLAINGLFSIIKSKNTLSNTYFFNNDFVIKNIRESLKSDDFIFINKNYPLLRQTVDIDANNYNIVIILLESWSAKYIDSFSDNHLNVTKNFDKIANEGIRFTNFFANGQRSVDGITALFTGIPVLPGFDYLGHGLELSNLTFLANSAKNAGYSTLAMQSSKRGSFRLDSIVRLSGFDEYYGAEDFPPLGLETSGNKPKFGAWDNDMLSFYFQKINSLQEPFLAFTFTSSTHIPFISPGHKWEKYPHDDNHIFGFLNTLNYADEMLGAFMEKAKKTKWFDNTLFIFLADHTLGFGNGGTSLEGTEIVIKKDRVLEDMRIPLVVYAPKIFKEAKVIDTICSQADIFPSLTHLLGWKTPIATTSNSIFSTSNRPFALCSHGNTFFYIDRKGYIKHNLKNTLENTLDEDGRNRLLSFYQFLSHNLKENKISPN